MSTSSIKEEARRIIERLPEDATWEDLQYEVYVCTKGPKGSGVSDSAGIEALQSAVTQLPAKEFERFSQWFEEFLADQWDRQIEADILAGRLDAIGRRVDEEFEAGHAKPLVP